MRWKAAVVLIASLAVEPAVAGTAIGDRFEVRIVIVGSSQVHRVQKMDPKHAAINRMRLHAPLSQSAKALILATTPASTIYVVWD